MTESTEKQLGCFGFCDSITLPIDATIAGTYKVYTKSSYGTRVKRDMTFAANVPIKFDANLLMPNAKHQIIVYDTTGDIMKLSETVDAVTTEYTSFKVEVMPITNISVA